jgi:hypothetical protein
VTLSHFGRELTKGKRERGKGGTEEERKEEGERRREIGEQKKYKKKERREERKGGEKFSSNLPSHFNPLFFKVTFILHFGFMLSKKAYVL